ncbi:hypothetical protein [Candidatus Fukatsuia endosymbiont of Tuberolachnus salignus]|uniref:hypothetical protein n=1 Tax=Candidatus Fukatsuia endosymbiont of Tuberolachnus salignus TaxID=3077957 RepID=UPI00313D1F30
MSCIITVFNPLNISSFQNVDKAFEPKLTSWDKFFDFFRKIIFGADKTKEAQLRKIYGYISSEDNRIAIKNGFSDLINSTPYDYKNKFNITVDWNKNGTVIKLNYANSLIKQINLTAEERDLDDFFVVNNYYQNNK